MTEFLSAIESHTLVRFLVTTPWVYPALSALHILGIGVLIGAILTVDLRLLRVLGPALDEGLALLVRIALCGFVLAATTGLMLASVRISNYLANPAFLVKMSILAAAAPNAVVLRVIGGRDLRTVVGARRAVSSASLSIALWIGAVFAGRWIAFVGQ